MVRAQSDRGPGREIKTRLHYLEMDSFEDLIKTILERKGYWVRPRFKVELTKKEKVKIGRPSSPRWELDLLAYRASINEIIVGECKSFLDSPGVRASGFVMPGNKQRRTSRYKLFNEPTLRRVIFARLTKQLVSAGLVRRHPRIRLCLIAGNIASAADRYRLTKHFQRKKWVLWDDVWIRRELERLAAAGYDDEVASVVAKLLLRRNKM